MSRQLLLCTISAILLCAQLATGRTLRVPTEYSSIQSAIDAAVPGDTVLVTEGTYLENISFRGKNIVVASNYINNKSPESIRSTIIDGSMPADVDTGSVVRLTHGESESAELCGFTLRNGIGSLIPGSFAGGGVLITGAGNPTVCNNIIYGCNALLGAGIAVRNSAAVITNNVIYKNEANQGGALAADNASVIFDHNTLHQNIASIRGGAIFDNNSFLQITSTSITGNSAPTAGAIFCQGGIWSIQDCNFYNNSLPDFDGCGEPVVGDVSTSKNFNLDSADIYGNIRQAPGYMNPSQLDFSLECTSRLIDAGSGFPTTYPVGGARQDIGAWEFKYRIGDLNQDNKINLQDATIMVNIIFAGQPLPCPLYRGDCDCNRRINISDVVALVNYWAGFAETSCLFTPQ